MPFKDGLELARDIRIVQPECKIIFMSAYSDKDYLKSAIQIKAVNYIEKPLDIQELEETIKRAVEELNNEKITKNKEIVLERKFTEVLPAIKRAYVFDLCRNSLYKSANDKPRLGFEMLSTRKAFSVIVYTFRWKNIKNDAGLFSYRQDEIINHFDHHAQKYSIHMISVFKEDSLLIGIISSDFSKKNSEWNEILSSYISDTMRLVRESADVFVSIGSMVRSESELYSSYQAAVIAQQKLFFRGYNRYILSEHDSSSSLQLGNDHIDEFNSMLRLGKAKECQDALSSFVMLMKKNEGGLPSQVKEYMYGFLKIIAQTAQEKGISLFEEDGGDAALWSTFMKMDFIDDIKVFISVKLDHYFTRLENRTRFSRVVYEILEYIKSNYKDEDMSVQKISDHFYMNKTYLCTAFKKETGKTLQQYITEFRIETAKQLMKASRLKLSEVALEVGIPDANYFSKVFKRVTGISPTEFK